MILGLCVVVCVYDEEMKIGGMNYFMLFDIYLMSEFEYCLVIKYGVYVMDMFI